MKGTNMQKRRPLYLMAFGVVAVPLVAASIAYACSALASLSVSTQSADSGATVTGVGRSFSNAHGGAPSAEPVVLHFNSRTGPVLWSGRPDANGNVEFAFQVPQTAPGSYALIATQNNADGVPASGTPARATFQVAGPVSEAFAAAAAAPAAEPVAAAPAAAPAPVAAPAPAAAPAAATTPRVRVAPAAPAAAAPVVAPAPVATPAPAVEATPAPVAAPAPVAVTPEVAAPAAPAAPARRSVMVSMSGGSDGSPALAIALVGVGLVLALGASALVLAGRRDSKAPARARR
jgi:hypothetical protein